MDTREKAIRFELILLFAAGELILLFNARQYKKNQMMCL